MSSIWTEKKKQEIRDVLLARLTDQWQDLVKAAQAAHSGATHEDAQAKSKYDTHGLELSYLAGSQYERAAKLKEDIAHLEALKIHLANEESEIQLASLVELQDLEKSSRLWYFLCPYGAGEKISVDGIEISILSPSSPLGEELVDSFLGDEISLGTRNFLIESSC